MAQWLLDDDIDFATYMQDTEAEHCVISSGNFVDEVVDYFHGDNRLKGDRLPWHKTHGLIRFREGEVSLWSGINGHGKSLALGQACMGFAMQKRKTCIASLEMKPVITLARMYRQLAACSKPEEELIRGFAEMTDPYLFMYDQVGTVRAERILAVMRYCADKHGINHFVLDSLMKCGIGEDDYTAQKLFVDQICAVAKDTGMHIHLVAHSRKGKDEKSPPGKMDVKGSGTITDLVHNIFSVWRNKHKEEVQREGGAVEGNEADTYVKCDKQRNGEWEGDIALWFDQASLQFVGESYARTIDMTSPALWAER